MDDLRFNRRAALALGGAFLVAPTAAHAQSAPTAMIAAGVPEESATPALWAQQSGMFAKAGLDIEVQPANSGSVIASGVAGGSYAIGKSSLPSIIAAHVHNLPFVIISGGGMYDSKFPFSVLTVKADSPLRTAADLNGKTVAVSALSDVTSYGVKAWVDTHGGDSNSLKLIEYPFAQVPDVLVAGRVDAGFCADPILQQAIDAKKIRVFAHAFDAIAPQFMLTGWFTTLDNWNKSKVALTKFYRVMQDSAKYVVAHPSDTVAVLAKFSNVDPAVIERTHRISYAPLDPKYIQPVIDILARYKGIPSAFDARELIAPGIT